MSVVRTPRFGLAFALVCALVSWLGIALPAHAATLPTGFAETRVATGLSNPTAMALAPDGRIFVTQQGGALRVVKNGALLAQPFLTVSVDSNGERGLLGIAFDPNFATNNFVYVYYTTSASPIHNRVSRFTASAANPDVVAAGSEVQLLNLPNLSSATNHNGGAMHFGTDGKLYIAVGENANSANAPVADHAAGQDPAHQRGRLDPLGQSVPEPDHRHQPGDLGARACAIRSPSRSIGPTAAFTSTTWARTPGRRSTTASPAPTTAGRRPKGPNPPGVAGRALSDSHLSERRRVLRDHGCGVLPPDHRDVPRRLRRPLFLRRFLRRLHPHAEPAQLRHVRRLRHRHQLAGRHPGSPGRLALLPGARRRRIVPRAVHRQHRADHLLASRQRHGVGGTVGELHGDAPRVPRRCNISGREMA